jgi:hypothetical protein
VYSFFSPIVLILLRVQPPLRDGWAIKTLAQRFSFQQRRDDIGRLVMRAS